MIDLYCERTGPGLLAEPLNLLSNLAFFAAAWAAHRAVRRSTARVPFVRVLVGLVCAIGFGSALFHSFATRWAQILDVAPIGLFMALYLWSYARHRTYLSPIAIGLAIGGVLLAAGLGSRTDLANHSLGYVPALLALTITGLHRGGGNNPRQWDLLWAVGLFAAALLFRAGDQALCPSWSHGTHFVWHLLNGLVLWLAVRALVSEPASA